MERLKLNAQLREETGKEKVKKLRDKKLVPAVVYKKGAPSVNIKVDQKELLGVLQTKAGENVLLELEIKNNGKDKKKTVIIKEIQYHPIKEGVIHVDFNEILLTEAIRVNVPIVAKGEAEGVVKDGGTLEYIIRELEVECLPTQIPEKIEVEVAHLKIGDTVYVKDLPVPSGIKILNAPELIVMGVKPPYVEKPAEEVIAEEVTEPELIRKEKKEEEEAGEEAVGEEEKTPKEAKKEEKQTKQEKK